jgi:hypothetical protein
VDWVGFAIPLYYPYQFAIGFFTSPHFPIRYAIGTGFPAILRDRLPAILRGKPKERELEQWAN